MYPYNRVVRSPMRTRGKWHLLASSLHTSAALTICGQRARGWDEEARNNIDPRDICTNCLRDTP